jgi:RNA polymerase sigma-70 factor
VEPREFVAELVARPRATQIAPALVAAMIADLEAARTRWPGLPLDDAMVAAVARKLDAADLDRLMPKLRIADLALATWAGRGDPAGIAAFESTFAGLLSRIERRFHRMPADELRQQLRIKLFVDPARIHSYSGFGFLENWLKVTAVRVHLDFARGDARQQIARDVDQDDLLDLPSPTADPADALLRSAIADAVKESFAAAVIALSPRERNFLRHAHVEGRTHEQIAKTYAVDRATVSRVLARARETLLVGMRGALIANGVAGDHLDSLVTHLDGQIDLSLSRVLRAL